MISTLALEIITLYWFGRLQQYKYPEFMVGEHDSYSFAALYRHFGLLMIVPEGFKCDTQKFG